MEKLYKYMQKIGIAEITKHTRPEETPAAAFYRETYGDRGYFPNAPGYTYPGAVIMLQYGVEAPADFFRKQKTLERLLEKYASRYGYTVRRSYCYGVQFLSISRADDIERANSYYHFRDACREECEQTAHRLYEAGQPEKVNAALLDIMNTYGTSYSEFLQNVERGIA